jgi:adenylate cyclase
MIEPSAQPTPPRRRRVPLSLFLAGTIGLAMLVSLGLVLWLTLGTARENTARLLGDKAQLVLTLVRARTSQFLEPAEALTASMARSIERGDIDPADEPALVEALSYTLAAAPQVNAVVYVDAGGWLLSVFRDAATDGIGFEREDWRADPAVVAAIEHIRSMPEAAPHWGEPLYSTGAGTTLIYFARPLRRPDGELGIVVATTTVENLSRFIASIETPGDIGAFVLLGRDRVLAHPELAAPDGLLSPEAPLPTTAALHSEPLSGIWADGWEDRQIDGLPIKAHWFEGQTDSFVYLYEEVDDDREIPWIVGGYFRTQDIGHEWQEVNRATMLALVLLLLSLVGAALLARKLARPATQIAETARAVSALKLDHIRPMSGSRIRELDDAERSLNAMVGALGCFIRYLPRDLVDYVLRYPERDIGRPRRRPMTIMFTDISGFTRLAESLDPEAAGALLNDHFGDLEASIRATGGVIDKYMGDGLLAFWGAPEPVADHQQRAVEAALAMARAVRRRNANARIPLRLRVGIAWGEILVGDLGAPTRTNYTVIGDAVNVAQRLLAIGHVVAPDHVTVIVSTAACMAKIRAEARPATRSLGLHHVRGRHGQVELVEILEHDGGEPVAAERATPAAVPGE